MFAPLTPDEFAALMVPLGPFEDKPCVAVAVSGGADSLALARLSHDWARQRGGQAIGVTVDHALRPDSGQEATQVADWLGGWGMDHVVLRWDGRKPGADIQAQARAARYGLLEEWAAGQGILHVLLAHHLDDQAETVMLRLGRGSGVDGLSAMAAVQDGMFLRWLRPLLSIPRGRLAASLTGLGQGWIEDPSNRNAKFARVRMRQMLPGLAGEGLSPLRLADTARRMGRARAALEDSLAKAAAHWTMPHPGGYVLVDPAAFSQLPDEIGLRLVARLLMCVGGGQYVPRAERSEALLDRLRGGPAKTVTVAGCRVGMWRGRVLFSREVGRMAAPLGLVPGAEQSWDGRFRFRVAADAPLGLVLGGLGTGEEAACAKAAPHWGAVPSAVRATLPSIRSQDALCAVPHLGYNRSKADERTLRWIVAAAPNPLTVAGHCLV